MKKVSLSGRKPNSKKFYPIGQWPQTIRMMKKTIGRKSRLTIPLNIYIYVMYCRFNELHTYYINTEVNSQDPIFRFT